MSIVLIWTLLFINLQKKHSRNKLDSGLFHDHNREDLPTKVYSHVSKAVKFCNLKIVISRKLSPRGPRLLSSQAPQEVKIIFGRFLASITAQVWRNITKIAKNVDFKKTGPPSCRPPDYYPPWPPWESEKKFWEVSGIYLSSSLKKYHQKYQKCRF